MTWRKTIFWVHLVSGLAAGVVVFVMSATGILIAFEEEILDWIDREVSRAADPRSSAAPPIRKLPIRDLAGRLASAHPEFGADSVHISRDA